MPRLVERGFRHADAGGYELRAGSLFLELALLWECGGVEIWPRRFRGLLAVVKHTCLERNITCTGNATPQECLEDLFGLRELRLVAGQQHWVVPDVPVGDINVQRQYLLCAFPPFLKIKIEGQFGFTPHDCKDLLRFVVRADTQVASTHEPKHIAQLSHEYALVAVAWGHDRVANLTTYDVQGRIRSSTASRPSYPDDAYVFYIRMSRSVPLAKNDELTFKVMGQ
ncbi:hypothetical protein PG984_008487 [Apiospora sp. TS-2023a]